MQKGMKEQPDFGVFLFSLGKAITELVLGICNAFLDFFNVSGHDKSSTQYYNYIASARWKQKAAQIRLERGHKCEICGANNAQLEVHHLTYERLGNELSQDLKVLCSNCHKAQHSGGLFK